MRRTNLAVLERPDPLEQLMLGVQPSEGILPWVMEKFARTSDSRLKLALLRCIVRHAPNSQEMTQFLAEIVTDKESSLQMVEVSMRGLVRFNSEGAKRALMFAFWKSLRSIRTSPFQVARSKRARNRVSRQHARAVARMLITALSELGMQDMLAKAEFFGYRQELARPLPELDAALELGIYQLHPQKAEERALQQMFCEIRNALLEDSTPDTKRGAHQKARKVSKLRRREQGSDLLQSIVERLTEHGAAAGLAAIVNEAVDTRYGLTAARSLMSLAYEESVVVLERALMRSNRPSFASGIAELLSQAGADAVDALVRAAVSARSATARMEAIRAAGPLPLSESDQFVLRTAAESDPSRRVRVEALHVLGEHPSSENVNLALSLLSTGRASLRERRASREMLAACGPATTADVLHQLGQAKCKKVQRDAAKVLAKFGREFAAEIESGVELVTEPVLAVWNRVEESPITDTVAQLAPEFIGYAQEALKVEHGTGRSSLEVAASRLTAAILWGSEHYEALAARIATQFRMLQPMQRADCVLGLLAAALSRLFSFGEDDELCLA